MPRKYDDLHSPALGNSNIRNNRDFCHFANGDQNVHNRGKTKKTSSPHSRSRQGVGMIIGGVILAAILFTSVYYFFFVIMEGQTIRGKTDANIQQLENNKKLEQIAATSFENQTTHSINVKVQNTGSIPTKVAYVVIYDKRSIPVDTDATIEKKDIALNSGHEIVFDTGIAADESVTYTIDSITERGNVVTALWPAEEGLSNEQIKKEFIINSANGFGSLQLDFKSLGVIFWDRHGSPDQPMIRSNIDQRGWDVKFGNTTGYPAFLLPGTNGNSAYKPEVVILRVRNVDPSGQNITLYANTGLGLSLSSQNSQQSPGLFLCFPDPSPNKHELYPYNENNPSRTIVLPNALKYGLISTSGGGWVYLYFCDASPGNLAGPSAITKWEAKKNPDDLNPIILVARGEFTESFIQYGQTIPYQAVTISDDAFFACLKANNNIELSKACPNTTGDKYTGKRGDTAYAYIAPPKANPPYSTTALWLNPDGSVIRFTSPTASTNPFPITVPDVPNGKYIIQIIDKDKNIYSMTFSVTN